MNASANRTVLVAEDNAISREILVHQLRLLGCDAVAVTNGAEAARAWRAGSFGLLLTDLQMPELDGYQLSALIRREESSARMPIVALTANGANGEAEQCSACGMDACLTKPPTLAQLRGVVERWVGAGRAASHASLAGSRP